MTYRSRYLFLPGAKFLSCFARRETIAKGFMDDQLWSLIEPLLPAHAPRVSVR
jgi:hypothetical protein